MSSSRHLHPDSTDTPMRRIHTLTYLVATHDKKRQPKLHARRDLCAGLELVFALSELGYRYGEPILNQPPRRGPQKPAPGEPPFPVDLSFVDADDILLQVTRPPFSDIHSGPIRQIALAHTDLELRTFDIWKRYLRVSARNHVLLSPHLHDQVLPGYEPCREMSFKQKGWGAPYSELNDQQGGGWRKVGRGKRRTALFLLRLEHAWPGGPGYVCAFGMDGCTTTVWAYRLARDLKIYLKRPGFVMCELELGRIPDLTTDLRWCLDWKISPVLVHHFDEAPLRSPDRELLSVN